MKNEEPMKKPEITWSLMHPTPLDPDYIRRLIKKTKEYPVDSFEICAQCHTPYGGLDGLIFYDEYPTAAANWNQDIVKKNREQMNEIIALSHAAGKQVYYFHREVMVPPGLIDDIPELLDENGEFDLLSQDFAKLIKYKLDRTFEAVPGLDGIVLTLTEADFSAIHNSDKEKYPPVEVVRFVIEIFASELDKRGKRFVMRSFGSIAQDYEDILAGAEKLAGKYQFEIETKITPYDFVPFLPMNPFLRKSSGFTLSAECDSVGEFMGQGNMPFEHVHHLVRYVREGQASGVDRFVIRLDRRGNCIFDVYEINYYAYSRALEDPDVTAEEIRREWYEKKYPVKYRDAFIRLDKMGWEMVCKTYFIDKHVLFHGNYMMKYLKAAFVFPLFHENISLKNGRGVWSIQADRKAPGSQKILREKEEAVALADSGLALYESLDCQDYRHRLWKNAVVVTRCVRELTRCIAAYFEDMKANSEEASALKVAVAAAGNEFERLAGHPLTVQKQNVINGMEHRVNEVNLSIEEICIVPLNNICQALLEEYAGERAAQKKFLPGTVDGIITGGIFDEHRQMRYMHASHAELYKGFPTRWAGNRVFPNGFFEMQLNRGKELCIHGVPEESRNFRAVLDGVSMDCRMDDNGVCVLPLPGGSGKVHVRLEKHDKAYPRFYAVSTK